MTPEERRARIRQLEEELRQLRAEEYAVVGAGFDNIEALRAECLRLRREGLPVQAIQLYRAGTGCGLREAKDAVEGL